MHQKEILTTAGFHKITLTDDEGNMIEKQIEFVGK
jgi:hypothetical protein